MIRKTICAGLLLGLSFAASGEGRVISQAYEVPLSEFRAPATTNGGVTFKTCSTCAYITVRVGPGTTYTLDGDRIELEDLRGELQGIHDRDAVWVTVLRHLESDTVVSIAVTLSE